ncbi:MAG: hypothetical protein LBV04_10260, partial [Deferribacteraceae bacterium]|nr:hypothetical protein [Deferribacteraceae bacterium]
MFTIEFTSRSIKQLRKLERNLRIQYAVFFITLMTNPFIGKLDDVTYHAHVKYHWVAVWKV